MSGFMLSASNSLAFFHYSTAYVLLITIPSLTNLTFYVYNNDLSSKLLIVTHFQNWHPISKNKKR